MNSIIYFNGQFIKESDAHIPVTTHALHYGTGCFEGIRAYYSEKDNELCVFRMEDHYKRLFESCKILSIKIPHTVKELCDITTKLLVRNFEKTDIYIRPLAYKADPAVGNFNLKALRDGFLIYTVPLGRYLNIDKGIKTRVSSWIRVPDNAIPPRGKITGSYANATLAKNEALQGGYDEAIFLDREGHVVEGSTENIFVVKDGMMSTPPSSSDILLGITRQTVMDMLKNEFEIHLSERNIDRSELYQADEVFLVGTGAEISPVIEIDNRPIGTGKTGTLSTKIKDLYSEMVHGKLPKYEYYLTKVTQK